MRIHITTKNIELGEEIAKYIKEKIGELDKFINYPGEEQKEIKGGRSPVEVWVEIGRTTFHHRKGDVYRAEVQLHLSGKSLRAESESEDLKASITDVKDELQKELKKYKGKAEALNKRRRRFMKKLRSLSPLARFKKRKRNRLE